MNRFKTQIRRHPRLVAGAILAPLVVVNLLVRGPAAPLPNGPSDVAVVDRWVAAQVADAGIPGAAIVIVRDGRIIARARLRHRRFGGPTRDRDDPVRDRVAVEVDHGARGHAARRRRPDRARRARPALPARVRACRSGGGGADHRPPAAHPDERSVRRPPARRRWPRRRRRWMRGSTTSPRSCQPPSRGPATPTRMRTTSCSAGSSRSSPRSRSGPTSRVTSSIRSGWPTRDHGPLGGPGRRPERCPSPVVRPGRRPIHRSTGRTWPPPAGSSRQRRRPRPVPRRPARRRAVRRRQIASADAIRTMQTGTVPTGLGDERYGDGLGGVDIRRRADRGPRREHDRHGRRSRPSCPTATSASRSCSTPRARSTSCSTSRTRSASAPSRSCSAHARRHARGVLPEHSTSSSSPCSVSLLVGVFRPARRPVGPWPCGRRRPGRADSGSPGRGSAPISTSSCPSSSSSRRPISSAPAWTVARPDRPRAGDRGDRRRCGSPTASFRVTRLALARRGVARSAGGP